MAGSTISTTISHGVTLGNGTYASPLTITSGGAIVPAGIAETGLYAALAGGYIANAGTILAGSGTSAASAGGVGSIGGIAVELIAGSLTNTGFIMGGKAGGGGAAQYGGTGGLGGYGVDVAGGSLTNQGTVMGGRGGGGGNAVSPASSGSYFGGAGGIGGAGALLSAGTLINDATLIGGNGGPGGAGGGYQPVNVGGIGGAGGPGADVTAGVLVNNGTILGGAGGPGGVAAYYTGPVTASSGPGGIGLVFPAGGTLTNAGFIGHGTGAVADALDFGTGASRLILAPHGSFNGLVVANKSFTNTLELTTGSGAGTLGVVGSAGEYRGFASLFVDAGANWTLANAASTFSTKGSIDVAGSLANTGTIVGAASILIDGSLTNTGTIADLANRSITVHGDMTNDGVIVGTSGVSLVVSGNLLNAGVITTGAGTTGAYGAYKGGPGGAGGNAVSLAGGNLTNTGTLFGGVGGGGGYAGVSGPGGPGTGGMGGTGGAGVSVASGLVTNLGTLLGGAGGAGGNGPGGTGAAGIGGAGVLFASGGTLTNGGLIASGGNGGDAVNFGTGAARLILDPGASFAGSVVADASLSNLLELASAATSGSIAGIGDALSGFGTIAFDANASWSITGSSAGIASGETVSGFILGDTIELTGFAATGDTFTGAGLVLAGTGGPKTIGIQGAFTTASFNVTTASGNTFVELAAPCFAAGTRIATPRGHICVEDLHAGELVQVMPVVRAQDGVPEQSLEPIRWLGHRRVDCTRHPQPHKVWPVRIAAGAFGPGLPCRNLLLSPDHAILFEDVLIPVKCLIDQKTIVQTPRRAITYHHVELAHHAVLLAEGLPVESYLDTGDRQSFANASVVALHPDFASRIWEARGCAPLVVSGPKLDAVRHALARDRARRKRRSA